MEKIEKFLNILGLNWINASFSQDYINYNILILTEILFFFDQIILTENFNLNNGSLTDNVHDGPPSFWAFNMERKGSFIGQ